MPNTKISSVKVCDAGIHGTLFNVHSTAKKYRTNFNGKADQVSNTWHVKQLEYSWLLSLMTESVPLCQATEKAKVYVLSSSEFKDAALRKKLLNLYLQLSCYPKVPRAPKARQDTGKQSDTLSNDPRDMLDLAVSSSALGKLPDTSVLIDDVGVFKVDPRIYEVAMTHFSYEACAICLISSNTWTASYTEFRFALVNSLEQPLEHLPGGPSTKIKNCDESLSLLGL